MTGPVEPPADPDAGARARGPAFQFRSGRLPNPVAGRWAALTSVVVVVVVVAVVSVAVSVPAAAPSPSAADGVPIAPAGAYSSSAFCPSGTGTAASDTVYLTNSSWRTVDGTMTAVSPSGAGAGATAHQGVTVPPRSTVAVDPGHGLPAGSLAAAFVFAGGGVVANQAVSGPDGWSTAPCATQTASNWMFAGGSTSSGDELTLDLFNPSASEATVNVSFLTPGGVVTPASYQGLSVPVGALVEENVGDYVQNDSVIATMVTAQSGSLVSSEFQQFASGSGTGVSLRLGAPAPSTTWRFAQTTSPANASVAFDLANPESSPVTATISVGLSSGSVVPRRVDLAPDAVVAFSASSAGMPQQVAYATTVTATGPIVVGRTVQAPSGATAPLWGSSSGTTVLARRWLVPAPGTATAPGTAGATVESLAVFDPGPSPARVKVTDVGASQPRAAVTVAPRQVVVLGAGQVGGLVALSVASSAPVAVEEDSGPSGAPGVVSSTGFPFSD